MVRLARAFPEGDGRALERTKVSNDIVDFRPREPGGVRWHQRPRLPIGALQIVFQERSGVAVDNPNLDRKIVFIQRQTADRFTAFGDDYYRVIFLVNFRVRIDERQPQRARRTVDTDLAQIRAQAGAAISNGMAGAAPALAFKEPLAGRGIRG